MLQNYYNLCKYVVYKSYKGISSQSQKYLNIQLILHIDFCKKISTIYKYPNLTITYRNLQTLHRLIFDIKVLQNKYSKIHKSMSKTLAERFQTIEQRFTSVSAIFGKTKWVQHNIYLYLMYVPMYMNVLYLGSVINLQFVFFPLYVVEKIIYTITYMIYRLAHLQIYSSTTHSQTKVLVSKRYQIIMVIATTLAI